MTLVLPTAPSRHSQEKFIAFQLAALVQIVHEKHALLLFYAVLLRASINGHRK